MADTTFRPGDTDNNLLRKILEKTGGGGGGGGGGLTDAELRASPVLVSQTGGTGLTNAELRASPVPVSGTVATGALTDTQLRATAVPVSGTVATGGLTDTQLRATAVPVSGNVGGFTAAIKDTTAVSVSPAYTAGDAVGGKRTLANAVKAAGTGVLESIVILDRANQKAAMKIIIFDADPTVATITDNAAFVFSTDDLKAVAVIDIPATAYVTLNTKAIASVNGIGAVVKAASGTSLYAAVVTTGTPTYAATTDVQVVFGILQD
jgi:hypothetical protein